MENFLLLFLAFLDTLLALWIIVILSLNRETLLSEKSRKILLDKAKQAEALSFLFIISLFVLFVDKTTEYLEMQRPAAVEIMDIVYMFFLFLALLWMLKLNYEMRQGK